MKLREITFFALLAASSGQAGQSLLSGTGTTRLPSGVPFSAIGNWRAEIRLTGWNYNNAYQSIFGTNSFSIRVAAYSQIILTSWQDSPSACGLSPAGGSDLILRVQRDVANSRLTVETWNAVNGSGYQQAVCHVTLGHPNDAGSNVWVGGSTGALAYTRIYSTVVPLGTGPANTYNGDLLDYELEGSGLDNSTTGANLVMSGAVYGATPMYPPAVTFGYSGQPRTFRAGAGQVRLDASASFSSADNATLQHFWQQLSGPSEGQFSTRTAPVTIFTAPLAGTYNLQDTVCDNLGNCGKASKSFGAVATDAAGFVITGSPATDFILGPLTMSGTSPWPWYDVTEGADADVLAPYQENVPPSVPMTGTATVTGSDPYSHVSLVGTGTHFLSETAVGNVMFISWPTPDGLTGVVMAIVASITDDTHLQLDRSINPVPWPVGARIATSTGAFDWGAWGLSGGRITDWNFYDDVLALYRHYYRTGRSEYLTQARALADNWYHYALDHGYFIQYPRVTGLQGIIARALDGKPEYWTGILAFMNYPIAWQSQFTRTTPLPAGSNIDPREYGYMLRWAALIAKLHPDPAVRAAWCTNVTNAVTNVWPYVQDSLGNFEEDVYNENAGYPYAPTNGQFGSSPWRSTLGLLGLQKSYEVLSDPSVCNNPGVAAATLAVIEGFTRFAHDYGKSGNRGQLYSVNYSSVGQDPLSYVGFNGSTPHTIGTLSVTPGSATVTGTGTFFTTIFWHAPCTVLQPWCIGGLVQGQQPSQYGPLLTTPTNFIGIPAQCMRQSLRVASVESDTQLTLLTPWPSSCPAESGIGTNSSASGVGWVATWEGNTQCGQYSAATHCEGGPTGDRNLTHDLHEAYLWLYQTTGNATYYQWGEDSLAADYGGSAGGPGSSLPFAGPLADGNTGFMQDPTKPCSVSAPPCGGNGPTNNQGKAFGQSTGAGNAANAIARYLGERSAPYLRTVYLGFDASAVNASTAAQVVVTAPSGASTVFPCSSSPCAVTYDTTQGASQAVLRYLSSNGQVLSAGSPLNIQ